MIAGIVLAAGGSRRLGRPKQLLPLEGRTLVEHAADCCLRGGCGRVVVVLGAEAERVAEALAGLEVDLVINERWREGIASSIRAGLDAVPEEAAAALVAVCDQPRLTPRVVRDLLARFDGTPGAMVACEYGGTVGVPAVFGRGRFSGLRALRGDHGARELLRGDPRAVARLPWPDGALDVDEPGDRGRT